MTLQTFPSLDDAIALAEFAHRNQRDQSGAPYIRHPMRVLQAVQEQGAPPYVQIAAVLHDVTEDTAYTPEMLIDLGILPAAVDIIRLVDRHVSRAIFDELAEPTHTTSLSELKRLADKFYYSQIRNNPGALQVKLADIGDNRLPWRLVYLPQAKQDYLNDKYTKAIKLLTE
jgi:hypothetical protein